jgi:hypothetical protein
MISHGGGIMTTLPEAAKTVFGERDVAKASATEDASVHDFASKLGSIHYRNHATLTARGWLAHRTCWPKDQHMKYGVAITFGDDRILVSVAPARNRQRS